MTSQTRRLATVAAVVVFGAIGPSDAQASVEMADDDVVITVVDEGDPAHRVLLGSPPPVGTMADSTTNNEVDMSVSGQGLPIALDIAGVADMARTTQVLTADADGAYTARETFTSFNQTTSSASANGAELMGLDPAGTADFGPLVDVPLIVQYGADGTPVSADVEGVAATPELDAVVDLLVDNGFGTEAFTAALPSTPVGQGAVWTVAEPAGSATTIVPLTMRFTLVSLNGDDYSIEIGTGGDALEQLAAGAPGTDVTGELTLTGTLVGNAANRLDQQLSMDLLMDVTVTEDGESVDLDIEISIDHTSTPR